MLTSFGSPASPETRRKTGCYDGQPPLRAMFSNNGSTENWCKKMGDIGKKGNEGTPGI